MEAVDTSQPGRAREIEAERLLQTLTYGVSHDLRGPLRGIETHAAMLEKRLGDGAEDALRDHLSGIRDAARRMGSLLDGLSELSRANRAELRPAKVDLSLLADWSAAEVCQLDASGIELEVQPGMVAHGDERLLKLMLDQLIENACTFARGSHVRIGGEAEDGGFHLRVEDGGIGFEAEQASRLFTPFTRLHGSDAGAGHGIGLAIVGEVVRRHGGRAWAEGAPGQGATFHVWLPDAPA